jgi:hypothetical protein
MKAIKVTQDLKDANPTIFGAVDSIYSSNIPKTFVRGNNVVLGYNKRNDLQALDGWQNIIEPTIGKNQRRGSLIELNGDFTYSVEDYTAEQIAAKGNISIPRNTFKLALLKDYGVKNSDVDGLFAALVENNLAPEQAVEEMKILWYESAVFKNTTPELFQFATNLGLTETQLKQIFINHASI